METKDLNRIKVVLAENKCTNKWLAERLGKDSAVRPLLLAIERTQELFPSNRDETGKPSVLKGILTATIHVGEHYYVVEADSDFTRI